MKRKPLYQRPPLAFRNKSQFPTRVNFDLSNKISLNQQNIPEEGITFSSHYKETDAALTSATNGGVISISQKYKNLVRNDNDFKDKLKPVLGKPPQSKIIEVCSSCSNFKQVIKGMKVENDEFKEQCKLLSSLNSSLTEKNGKLENEIKVLSHKMKENASEHERRLKEVIDAPSLNSQHFITEIENLKSTIKNLEFESKQNRVNSFQIQKLSEEKDGLLEKLKLKDSKHVEVSFHEFIFLEY